MKNKKGASIVARDTLVPAFSFLDLDTTVTIELETVISLLERKLIDANLVSIKDVDSTIRVDLRYSTSNNFLNTILYDSLIHCYLQPDVAKKVSLAQFLLQSEHADYRLKIYDGVRPRSVQQKMWNMLDMPTKEKTKYVSNPKNGSLHNFGAAVDLTIINGEGKELDMATDYDFFGELAYPRLEQKMIAEGKLTQEQLQNRLLLRRVMKDAGFMPITTEWWHFNSCYRKEAWEKYKIVE
jgi:D-alanyl-D-alanine dipeptidase